jgi:hypothetical protein
MLERNDEEDVATLETVLAVAGVKGRIFVNGLGGLELELDVLACAAAVVEKLRTRRDVCILLPEPVRVSGLSV